MKGLGFLSQTYVNLNPKQWQPFYVYLL